MDFSMHRLYGSLHSLNIFIELLNKFMELTNFYLDLLKVSHCLLPYLKSDMWMPYTLFHNLQLLSLNPPFED